MNQIKEHMEVIGADGVHIGTVDKVEGNRIKLTKADSGEGKHRATIISSTRAWSPKSRVRRYGCRPTPTSR